MQRIIYRDLNVTIFQSALFQANTTVVVTDDAVLVVDPAWLPDEVIAIKQYVDSIRGRRLLFLVYSHADGDHIVGHGAFQPDKVFATKAFADRHDADDIMEKLVEFDQKHYITRPYDLSYPYPNYQVFKDGVQYRHGRTRLAFYNTPGHTECSMMMVVWQLGLCISGDYLCTNEFPLIFHSSIEYERTLDKIPHIHDRNWFTRLIPSHGKPALSLNDWSRRRVEALAYIYSVRESIATGVPFDESSLWERYPYPRALEMYHRSNYSLMQREYEQGLWTWDKELSQDLFQPKPKRTNPMVAEEIVIEEDDDFEE
jgi:hydroxyacylglutathione hydrolase